MRTVLFKIWEGIDLNFDRGAGYEYTSAREQEQS